MPRVTIKNDFTPADPYSETDANNIGTNLLNIYDEAATFTGVKTFNTKTDHNGGVYFDTSKHSIQANDGGGTFNYRVSNTFAGGMTENGYGSNWEYDKTTGVWSFKTTTTSQLAGETPVYDTPFKIGHNYINLKGSYVDDTLDLIPFTWETTTLISDLFARLDSYFSLSPNGFYASPGTVDDTILSMFGKYTGTRYEFYNPTRQTILVLEAGSVGAMATAGSVLIHRR